MKKFNVKFAIFIIAILVALILPTQVFGTNEGLQIIETDNQDYIMYVKELLDTEFYYAVSQSPNTEEIDLNYKKSEKDDDGNQVIFITKEKYEDIKDKNNYLFVKKNDEQIIKAEKLDFSEAFSIEKVKYVESVTKRITTQLDENIVQKDEQVNGINVKVTVGGLRITKKENANYYYAITKLPSIQYNDLKDMIEQINSEYSSMDMYSKIELIKQFYELYQSLSQNQQWIEVVDDVVTQPEDAQKGEEYVVFLREVDENNQEITDVKVMTSYREDSEDKIPGRTDTKVTKETSKLPITGDSIILFIVLAVVVLLLVIVFIRMKKLQNKKG